MLKIIALTTDANTENEQIFYHLLAGGVNVGIPISVTLGEQIFKLNWTGEKQLLSGSKLCIYSVSGEYGGKRIPKQLLEESVHEWYGSIERLREVLNGVKELAMSIHDRLDE